MVPTSLALLPQQSIIRMSYMVIVRCIKNFGISLSVQIVLEMLSQRTQIAQPSVIPSEMLLSLSEPFTAAAPKQMIPQACQGPPSAGSLFPAMVSNLHQYPHFLSASGRWGPSLQGQPHFEPRFPAPPLPTLI